MQEKIASCEIIMIGHLKWNPFFGEKKECPSRGDPSTCTSCMIRGEDWNGKPYVLVTDPTLRNTAEEYYFEINRRTGLLPSAVTHCFITHEHFDHQAGVNYFPDAKWLAAPAVAENLKGSVYIDGTKVYAVQGEIFPGVQIVSLLGHTRSLHGLEFVWRGKRTVIAGDSVMTREHFEEERGMFEEDREAGKNTISWIKRNYDIVVPGHDNWFWVMDR